jgi:choice-of-anchor B domain-containing protein
MKVIIALFLITLTLTLPAQIKLNTTKYAGPLLNPGEKFAAVWGYEDPSGNEYAIVGVRDSIRIYNVNDPRNPNKVYSYGDGTYTTWREFKTYRNYLYAVCDNCTEGLEIINMDSLASNHFRQDQSLIRSAHNIYIDTASARMFLCGARYINGTSANGIFIYSLSNPANPVMVKFHNTGMYSHDIFVRDNICYASNGYSGTFVYDYSDINNISLLSSSSFVSGYHHSVWVDDAKTAMYSAVEVPLGKPMNVYKLIGNNIVYQSDFRLAYQGLPPGSNTAHNPHIVKNYLYVSYYHDGIGIFDISNPLNPLVAGHYDTDNVSIGSHPYSNYYGAWGVYPFLKSGNLLVSDIDNGFYIIGFDNETRSATDLVLDTPGAGFIMKNKNLNYKLTIDNSGAIQFSSLGVASSASFVSKTKDLVSDQRIFLRSPNGDYYYLSFNGISVSAIPGTPVSPIKFTGDFAFDDYNRGPLLKNGSSWYRMRVNSLGILEYFLMY